MEATTKEPVARKSAKDVSIDIALFPAITSAQRKADRIRAEKAVGRHLKFNEDVHHHTDGTPVVCEGKAYHKLLHMRTRALKAYGHADWRMCKFCRKYDDPSNLQIYPSIWGDEVRHVECYSEYRKKQYQRLFTK